MPAAALAWMAYLQQAFRPEFLSSWALVAVGVIGTLVAWGTLRRISQQTGAAIRAAEAARISAEAVMLAERAYIVMSAEPPGLEISTFMMSSGEDPVSRHDARVNIKIRNCGNTPARVTQVAATPFWHSSPEAPHDPPYGTPLNVQALLVHGASFDVPLRFSLTEKQTQEIAAGALSFWIIGYVDYVDTFDRQHRFGYATKAARHSSAPYHGERYTWTSHALEFEAGAGYNYDRRLDE